MRTKHASMLDSLSNSSITESGWMMSFLEKAANKCFQRLVVTPGLTTWVIHCNKLINTLHWSMPVMRFCNYSFDSVWLNVFDHESRLLAPKVVIFSVYDLFNILLGSALVTTGIGRNALFPINCPAKYRLLMEMLTDFYYSMLILICILFGAIAESFDIHSVMWTISSVQRISFLPVSPGKQSTT